jgi:hypothetical protein
VAPRRSSLIAAGVTYLVVNVYRPPSAQLQPTLDAVVDLRQQLAPAPARCVMVVGGDWNVHLPPQDDRPVSSSGIPWEEVPARDLTLTRRTEEGTQLLDWCFEHCLVTLTGRLQDAPVERSTARTRGNTRVDHVLVSASAFGTFQQHMVLGTEGSDHFPLALTMQLEAAPAAPGPLCSYALPTCSGGGAVPKPLLRRALTSRQQGSGNKWRKQPEVGTQQRRQQQQRTTSTLPSSP